MTIMKKARHRLESLPLDFGTAPTPSCVISGIINHSLLRPQARGGAAHAVSRAGGRRRTVRRLCRGILRLLIHTPKKGTPEKVTISAESERAEARMHWKSGANEPFQKQETRFKRLCRTVQW